MRLLAPLVLVLALVALPLLACKTDAPRPEPGASGSAAPAPNEPGQAGAVVVGKPPPDFTAKDHTGADITLTSFKGKPVVVYFYPKDETSGCTKEANSFKEAWKDLEKSGAVVIGISTDSLDSHRAFAKNHDLPFHLVSDESGTIAKSFGVPNRLGFLGRQTFVIGADGNVKKIYRDVDVAKHASEVLADVQS